MSAVKASGTTHLCRVAHHVVCPIAYFTNHG
jgi:hypothetical protein